MVVGSVVRRGNLETGVASREVEIFILRYLVFTSNSL